MARSTCWRCSSPALGAPQARVERQEQEVALSLVQRVDGTPPRQQIDFLKDHGARFGTIGKQARRRQPCEGGFQVQSVHGVHIPPQRSHGTPAELHHSRPASLGKSPASPPHVPRIQGCDGDIQPGAKLRPSHRVVALDARVVEAAARYAALGRREARRVVPVLSHLEG